ncbi:MAG: penicillin-binding protein 2 [Desulfobacterales bacterium]
MEKYLKTADTDWYKQRIIGIILVVVICMTVLFVRLFFLQVIKGEEYRRLSENNSIRLQRIEPFRGIILDRNGRMLVDNRPSYDLSIIPRDAKPVEETLTRLSRYLDVPVAELRQEIESRKGAFSYKPVPLAQDIGRNNLALVEVHRYDLPGIDVNVKPLRHYLNNQSASHLLGYLGEISPHELASGRYADLRSGDLIGKNGIERVLEAYLRGKSGGRQVEVNATGQVVRVLETVPATPGSNIFLTIDSELQKKTEELLEGVTGAAVAIEPATGQILALVSSPNFDQNVFVSGLSHEQWLDFVSDPTKPLTNRAIQGEYPPASTYKILTALAGLEEGVITEKTVFCCPGSYRFRGRDYRCWKKGGHGCVDVVQAIAQSCDVFFYQVGLAVGVDRLAWYAKAAGLGNTTGIDLSHESNGLIPTAAWKKRRIGVEWQEGETLSIAIGQGFNLVTPLQMAVMTASIANGGTRYQPQLLMKIESADGRTVKTPAPVVTGRLPVSEKTLSLVKRGLREVVSGERGTAKGARLFDMPISGKTGTAQVVGRKDDETEKPPPPPDHLKDHAWFVAFAPSDDPKIAIAVVVEHGEHGSGAGAPIAREMIKTYLMRDRLRPAAPMVAEHKPPRTGAKAVPPAAAAVENGYAHEE